MEIHANYQLPSLFKNLVIGPDTCRLYCGKSRKNSEPHHDLNLNLDLTMCNIETVRDIFINYSLSKFNVPKWITFEFIMQ